MRVLQLRLSWCPVRSFIQLQQNTSPNFFFYHYFSYYFSPLLLMVKQLFGTFFAILLLYWGEKTDEFHDFSVVAVLVSSGNDNSCLTYYRLPLSDLPFYREVLCCSPDNRGLSTSNSHCFLWKQELLVDGKLSAMSRKGFVFLKKKKIPLWYSESSL